MSGADGEMLWSGWGDPARAVDLPPTVRSLLEQGLALPAGSHPPVGLADVQVPESRVPATVVMDLVAAVGPAHVDTGAESRIRHTRGKSTADLIRLRGGDATDAPDAVVCPADHGEVLEVLRICAAHRLAVVPFGGGTSVVGGLTAEGGTFAGLVVIDLSRMDELVAVDPVSRTARLQPGVRGPRAESLLAEHGLTLGHFPQSYEYATIGGFAATRSSGQASAGYGRFDAMVVGLRVATPEGTVELGRAPASAAGPDLRQLFLGSEGTLGVITEVTLRVRPRPAASEYETWRFESFATGTAALRRLAQDGPLPTVLRLSDEVETAVGAAVAGSPTVGCQAVVGFEGTQAEVAARRASSAEVLRDAGGTPTSAPQGDAAGQTWVEGRFAAPYLRDALLDAGALVETLETATFWSALPALYDAVRAAVVASLTGHGTPPLVLCHISHVYETGASLYFTVLCKQSSDPIDQWRAAKAAASDAILAAGGTITHHHGVGIDHRAWYAGEVGPLAVEVLRAMKARLDPSGVLNPGVLMAPGSG